MNSVKEGHTSHCTGLMGEVNSPFGYHEVSPHIEICYKEWKEHPQLRVMNIQYVFPIPYIKAMYTRLWIHTL